MNCKHCGQEMAEEMKFCPSCGREQEAPQEGTSFASREAGAGPGPTSQAQPGNSSSKGDQGNPFASQGDPGRQGPGEVLTSLWKAMGAVNSFLNPLQAWLYRQGSKGKWMVFGAMLLLGLLPYLGLSIFSGGFLILGLVLNLVTIGVQYLLAKLPVDYAFKKAMIEPNLEAKRINILLLMLFGQIMELFGSRDLRALGASMASGRGMGMMASGRGLMGGSSLGSILVSFLVLLLTTFFVLSLFFQEFRDMSEAGLFAKGYIIMRIILAVVLVVLTILAMIILAAFAARALEQMFW